jgi:hypothetical protein
MPKTRDSIRETIYGFRDLTDRKQIASDNGFSNRWIYNYLIKYRARLLREKLRINRLTQYNYQTISCIPIVETDLSECPCAPFSGCTFYKTLHPIPQPIDKLKSVTSIDGQINYSFVEWERLENKIKSRIPKERTSAYYTLKDIGEGTHIYLYNDVHKKFITVTGIFEDPLKVFIFPGCDGNIVQETCSSYLDWDFILDPDLKSLMYDLAISQLLRAKSPASDLFNDGNDIITPSAPVK